MSLNETSAQSYKHYMLVNYDSRVVITSKCLIFTTVESYLTLVENVVFQNIVIVRYQTWINLCAIFLLVVSIVFIFCSIILMKFYQVRQVFTNSLSWRS